MGRIKQFLSARTLLSCIVDATQAWLIAEFGPNSDEKGGGYCSINDKGGMVGPHTTCVLQDALEVDAFAQSDEAFAAEALFEAYKTGTAEDVKSCIAKKNIFFDLDNNVSTVFPNFPNPLPWRSCLHLLDLPGYER